MQEGEHGGGKGPRGARQRGGAALGTRQRNEQKGWGGGRQAALAAAHKRVQSVRGVIVQRVEQTRENALNGCKGAGKDDDGRSGREGGAPAAPLAERDCQRKHAVNRGKKHRQGRVGQGRARQWFPGHSKGDLESGGKERGAGRVKREQQQVQQGGVLQRRRRPASWAACPRAAAAWPSS